ncbi:MAG TPA: hypothetical protein PK463_05995, partial [Limnochordia bacterium]|nr:hypothetical protein [Limnochordia bacterium]
RAQWAQARVGSTPTFGTIKKVNPSRSWGFFVFRILFVDPKNDPGMKRRLMPAVDSVTTRQRKNKRRGY